MLGQPSHTMDACCQLAAMPSRPAAGPRPVRVNCASSPRTGLVRQSCVVRWLGHKRRGGAATGAARQGSAARGGGWVMARVYVSSTVADMEQERRAVLDRLPCRGTPDCHRRVPLSGLGLSGWCLGRVGAAEPGSLGLVHRVGQVRRRAHSRQHEGESGDVVCPVPECTEVRQLH